MRRRLCTLLLSVLATALRAQPVLSHVDPDIDAPAEIRIVDVTCPASPTGQFSVRNRGTAPLVLTTSTRFIGPNASLYLIFAPALPCTILPGNSVMVSFVFDGLNAANGDRTDTLALISNDPETPQWNVIVREFKEGRIFTAPPRRIDLGTVMVGATRDSITHFVHRNYYMGQVSFVSRDSGSGRIRLAFPLFFPVTQAPGNSLTLQFSFTPVDTGRFSTRFTIRTEPCGIDTVVTVTGYGRAPIIHSDSSYPFGLLTCSDTASEEIVVSNSGNAPLMVGYPTLLGQDRDSFRIISPSQNGFPRVLQPGDRAAILVQARSAVRRSLKASLVFATNDPFAGKNPYSIALETDPTHVDLRPSASTIDFGTICMGEEKVLPLTLGSIASRVRVELERIDRTDSSAPFIFVSQWFLPFPVSPGKPGSQRLDLRFAPTRPGRFTDTLLIRSSPCDRLIKVVLTGTCISTNLEADRTEIQFGDIPLGTRSRVKVRLRNPAPPGSPPLRIRNLPLLWPADQQVAIVSPTIPPDVTLGPGDELEVTLEYAPTSASRLPSLRICADVIDPCVGSFFCLPIEGNGIVASIAASRPSLSMISRTCGAPAVTTDTLTVTNIGRSPLDVTSMVATPAPMFTVISPASGFTLAPGSSQRITVGYLPGTPSSTPTAGNLLFTTTDPQRPRFDVTLAGRRDTTLFELDRRSILFPASLSCAAPLRDSFVVRNTGTVADTIRRVDAGGALLSPAPPYVLPPGGEMIVGVAIAPSVDGPWRSVVMLGSAPCSRIDSVVLTGRRFSPSYTIEPIDFGVVMVGTSGTASARITNPNPDPIRIAGAALVPASSEIDLVPGQFPITIAPGASAEVSLRYTPLAAGPLAAGTILAVEIDSLCPATLESIVIGRGIRGGLVIDRAPIDLGTILGCQMRFDSVLIINRGATTVIIDGVGTVEPPVPGFALLTSPLSHTLRPGDTDRFSPLYRASLGSPGIHTQTFTVHTTDPDQPTLAFRATINHIYESLAFEGAPFPVTMPGATSRATRRLINNGTAPVTIRRLGISQPFSIVSIDPNVTMPHTLLPGDTITMEIEFFASGEGEFSVVLDLLPALTCSGFPEYTLTARAVATVAATARWGTTSGRPGDIVAVPLLLETDMRSADVASYTIAVGFNPTMLVPRGLRLEGTLSAGWMVTGSDIGAGEARFSLRGTAPLSGSGVLVYLEATVALGDSLATTIRSLDGTATTSGRALLTVTPGLFTLEGYCDIGGARLVRTEGAFALRAIRPNPASGMTEIEIGIIESGRTRLRVIDLRGREVATLLDGELEPRTHIIQADLGRIPNGLYNLELETPTGRLVRALIVTK